MRSHVFQVRCTDADQPVAGGDSCIATVPDGVLVDTGGAEPLVVVQVLSPMLRRLGHDMAARIGERLHHADWVITDEPAIVEEVGMHGRPDCVSCRASVDQALATLAHKREPLLVGALYWAG